MKARRLVLVITILATTLVATTAAWACPHGYAPCGEKHQLCCPAR